MNFEKTPKSKQQLKMEKLQRLNHKEKLVLFEVAYRLGVTAKKETTTNFLTTLHSDHLTGLSEKWHELSMRVSELGVDMASVSREDLNELLGEVLSEESINS